MSSFQVIKWASMPERVKFLALAIISILAGLAVYAILGGVHLAGGIILQAGMRLWGVLFPLSMAIAFLSFGEYGRNQWQVA